MVVTDQPRQVTVQSPDGNVIRLPAFPGARPEITSDNASEMGRRSAVARREKKEAAETLQRQITAAARAVRMELPDRSELAGLGEAIVLKMATMILTGEVPIRSAAEAANVARAWTEIVALEQGTPTEIHEMRDPGALAAKLVELREKAAERRGVVINTSGEDQP